MRRTISKLPLGFGYCDRQGTRVAKKKNFLKIRVSPTRCGRNWGCGEELGFCGSECIRKEPGKELRGG